MEKERVVSAIQNGTVIDHIPAGQAWKIVKLLELLNNKLRVTLGLNLTSKRLGLKDIIKVEGHTIENEGAHQVAIFAPGSTINLIKNYEIKKKITATLPNDVEGILICPNKHCITQTESVKSHFLINRVKEKVMLVCHYCQREFERDEVHDPH